LADTPFSGPQPAKVRRRVRTGRSLWDFMDHMLTAKQPPE
jgi:hypothetical protein